MPDVIGMLSKDAEHTIESVYGNATAFTDPGGPTYDYAVANRCIWTDPTGDMSSNDRWPVASVVLVLHPELPLNTSPIEPVQPGPARSFNKLERLFFTLRTEKPSEVWCKPYGDPGPAGSAPNVDLPNHNDGGEPWFCRRHRWC
ncbi:hypothetical protein ACQ86B_28665 (plasmid) [Mycolicibacterium aichiense]|uniref:hypothetical protein n=1 Tax=Mycolicibacterium aichiense TaxID=1799 RepID=UPI003D6745DD